MKPIKSFYKVNEIFHSIQGEGVYSGVPCDFIRMQGCDVGCSFCDTKYSWDMEGGQTLTIGDIISKMSNAKMVVITGGEPLMQDLSKLTYELRLNGKYIALETSGCVGKPNLAAVFDWIVVSPKFHVVASRFNPEIIYHAHELKFLIGRERDIDYIEEFISTYPAPKAKISIQPISQTANGTKLALEYCKQKNYRLSLQLQKYIGIR